MLSQVQGNSCQGAARVPPIYGYRSAGQTPDLFLTIPTRLRAREASRSGQRFRSGLLRAREARKKDCFSLDLGSRPTHLPLYTSMGQRGGR
jgi:hypothetical protein